MKRFNTFLRAMVIVCSFLIFTPNNDMQAQKQKVNITSKPLQSYKIPIVNGKNVSYVEFGRNGQQLGIYRQVGAKNWEEVGTAKGAGNFKFEEVNRDEWSVYLKDPSRSTFIQLDLHTKKIMYGGTADQKKRPLYDILKSSAQPIKPPQQEGKPNLKLVNGKNVNYVEFGRKGGKLGVYKQIAPKRWKEVGAAKNAGTFEFKELNRDEWSVYLKDEARNVSVRLDLHTKKVMFSDVKNQQERPIYEIIRSSAKVNGWLVQEVVFGDNDKIGKPRGKFIQKDGKGWVETSLDNGQAKFSFVQIQRDDWSVYLFDKSRNAHIQLDLHTKLVNFRVGKSKERPIYKILEAKSVKTPNRPITKPTPPTMPALTPQAFVHVSSQKNTVSNSTILDNTLANNNSQAVIFITPNWKAPYNPTSLGVYWHNKEWRIFNQDRSKNIPENYNFNVLVYPKAGPNVFVHKASKGNIFGGKKHITRIKHPYCNNDREAKLIVTQNYGTNTEGVYNNHPIGVYYENGYWTIYNQDMTPMPENAQFNVLILKEGRDAGVKGASVFSYKATKENTKTYSHVSMMDNTATNNNPKLLLFETSSWNTRVYNNHNTGVYYHGGNWSVYNRDKKALPLNAYFNVLVINPEMMNSEGENSAPKGATIKRFDPNKSNNQSKLRIRN